MKKFILCVFFLVTAAILYCLFTHSHPAVVQEQLDRGNIATNQSPLAAGVQKKQQMPARSVGQAAGQPKGASATESTNKPHNLEEWMDREYGHQIEFYGKVVADENEAPIAGADITFDWVNAQGQGLHASAVSDSAGLFSINAIKGKNLGVTAAKNGYYPRRSSFEYADPGRGLFTPDLSNPVIFRLHIKGSGVDLITSQSGITPDFPIHIPRDGTPVMVDLLHRTVGGAGQLVISENKPEYKDWKKATAWSFKLEIPDGGLIEENEEFPYEAPAFGYQTLIEFQFQKESANWTDGLKKDFYVKFGIPAVYGRLHLETSIMMGGALLTYAINPDGSQNLEPK